jgi:hypothetical protein
MITDLHEEGCRPRLSLHTRWIVSREISCWL